MRKVHRFSLVSLLLVMFCCLSLFFSDVLCAPAYAAVASVDPDDFISNVIVNGDLKTVYFSFAGIPSLVDVWENPSGQKTKFTNVTDSIGYRAQLVGTTSLRFRTFLLGVETWDNNPAASRSVIDISDIMPGASLDMNMSFGLNFTRISMVGDSNIGVNSLHVGYNFGFYMYDKSGSYLGVKWGSATNSEYEYGHTASVTYNPGYGYTFPSNVAYICPFLDVQCSDDISIFDWRFQLSPKEFSLSVNINMIYENSSTMDRVQEKLEDIESGIQDTNDKLDDVNQSIQDNGDKLDDVNQSIQEGNDKLDDIYTGGDAGQDLGDAGDKLSGSSGAVSDAVGGMSDDIGNVSEFEQGQFEHISSAFDQFTIVQDFGQFNTSLAFVSGYVQQIFSGLEDWQIVITLPLFLGLFFGLAQHVGGISHVRAVRAREARNDELHQARLDKIRSGGK